MYISLITLVLFVPYEKLFVTVLTFLNYIYLKNLENVSFDCYFGYEKIKKCEMLFFFKMFLRRNKNN